jgi:surface antigen
MRPHPSCYLRGTTLVACCTLLLTAAAQAQVNPFHTTRVGPRLSPADSRLFAASVERLNAAEPAEVGHAESWSNPRTKSSGTSTVLKVFDDNGSACHLVRHHVVAGGRAPGRDYRLTWCRTADGAWKVKS